MTTKNDSDQDKEVHRKFAKECFNKTWDFLDKESLTAEEELEMLNTAHTSRFHWSKIGTPQNLAISDWQVSRCYTKINDGFLGLKFAQKCLDLVLDNKIEDMYVSGYEGIARAYAILRDYDNARKYIIKAEEELEKVTDKEEYAIYEPQVKETKSLIKE